ncbi:MAG TPA: DUF4956 domain-containing protein [Propionibacteriaceae bacterium]|nr:DUF4956 domain-containing protein [Propionibacteriaceae bacterium]HPZ48564.1 DUF4956 domain-containing protein [Propionibacteriaceae bacterium]HQE32052.1 DUF4956 domain-containing protein [Propionibacteriaceae bacterium]
MSLALIYVGNLVAITILVLGLYFPRHRRKDLVTAYLGVNIGVMAVSTVLLNGAVGLGLGLGLFGVLSIIRLRSDELAQHEVAYYFSALALGLLGGLSTEPAWLTLTLMAVIVGGMWLGDHPHLLGSYHREVILLDRAFPIESDLRAHLEERLGAEVKHITVQKLDLVNDTTLVDVRYRRTAAATAAAEAPELERIR